MLKLLEENSEKIFQDLIITNDLGSKTPKQSNRKKYKEIGLQQITVYTEGESSTEWRDDLQDRQCCHQQLNRRYQEIPHQCNQTDTERQTSHILICMCIVCMQCLQRLKEHQISI